MAKTFDWSLSLPYINDVNDVPRLFRNTVVSGEFPSKAAPMQRKQMVGRILPWLKDSHNHNGEHSEYINLEPQWQKDLRMRSLMSKGLCISSPGVGETLD